MLKRVMMAAKLQTHVDMAQFIAEIQLPYYDTTNKNALKHLSPTKIIEMLETRYYPKI
jgi:hypothetical protein